MNLQIIQIWPRSVTSATENTSEKQYWQIAVASSYQCVRGANNLEAMLLKLIGSVVEDWLGDYCTYRSA